MRLLISVRDPEEATAAVAGGADIIDIKNPDEGPLGAQTPAAIQAIRHVVPAAVPLSATIGDVPNRPGSVALAAFGAAVLGVQFVKVGLATPHGVTAASALLRHVIDAVSVLASPPGIVAVGFGDGPAHGALGPEEVVDAAAQAGAAVCMLDTIDKLLGRSLRHALSEDRLAAFVLRARRAGMLTGLAGSLGAEDFDLVARLAPDIIGVRGAACDGDRWSGRIRCERVAALKRLLVSSARESPVVSRP